MTYIPCIKNSNGTLTDLPIQAEISNKLGTSNVGDTKTPIYLSNGEAKACTESLKSVSDIVDLIYPIGSYFITESSNFNTVTKVANHFGGTWVRIEDGRFLEACSSSPGTDKSAGLPNIKGMLYNARGFMGEKASETSTNGALSKQWIGSGSLNNLSWAGSNRQSYLYFNASEGDCGTDTSSQTTPTYTSKENSVYGKSTTVQPKSRTVYIYRRTA